MTLFVPTSVSAGIEEAIAQARATRSAVVIQGPAGCGKTMTLKRVQKSDPDALYMRVSFAGRSDKAAITSIADALGINLRNLTMSHIWAEIEEWMEEYKGSCLFPGGDRRFLMVDEAQMFDLNVMKEVADFPERFQFPVVFCGNSDILKRSRISSGAFKQIESRIARRITLTQPTADDFSKVALEFGVKNLKVRSAAVAIGENTSLRELVQVLEALGDIAGSESASMEMLRAAVVTVKGSSMAVGLLKSA